MASRRPCAWGSLVTAPIPNTSDPFAQHSTAAAWCNAEQEQQTSTGPPHPHQPQALRLRRPVSGRPPALVIPGGADSRVAAMHSLIAGVLPSRCGRETGGELRDMILQCPANYAATHAHRAHLSRSSLMAN